MLQVLYICTHTVTCYVSFNINIENNNYIFLLFFILKYPNVNEVTLPAKGRGYFGHVCFISMYLWYFYPPLPAVT